MTDLRTAARALLDRIFEDSAADCESLADEAMALDALLAAPDPGPADEPCEDCGGDGTYMTYPLARLAPTPTLCQSCGGSGKRCPAPAAPKAEPVAQGDLPPLPIPGPVPRGPNGFTADQMRAYARAAIASAAAPKAGPTDELLRAMWKSLGGTDLMVESSLLAGMRRAYFVAHGIAAPQPMTDAARDVLAERRRQVEVEGWTPEHDDEHDAGTLAAAGSAYALSAADALHPMSMGDGHYSESPPGSWPFDRTWWKPGDPRRDLVRAAALLLAEIERIDRAAPQPTEPK